MKNKRLRASVTLEASICLPILLSVMIYIISYTNNITVQMKLDHAVSETVKIMALYSYPVTFLNETEDSLLLSEEKEDEEKGTKTKNTILDLISGNFDISNVMELLSLDKLKSSVASSAGSGYMEYKNDIVYGIAEKILFSFLEGSNVDIKKLKPYFVQLPISGYENISRQGEDFDTVCKKLGFKPGKNDVVVAFTYEGNIYAPFIGRKNTSLHAFVERGWTKGSNGIFSSFNKLTEAGDNNKDEDKNAEDNEDNENNKDDEDNESDERVYITRTGSKYHREGCGYLEKSSIPLMKNDAVEKGYSPCMVCVLGTAKPIKKGFYGTEPEIVEVIP